MNPPSIVILYIPNTGNESTIATIPKMDKIVLDIPNMGMYNIIERYPIWGIGGVTMYKKLKAIRVEEGYTFQEMSNFLGYNSPNAYARKEKGERKFTLEEVEIISNLFKKTVEEIFFTHEIPNKGIKKTNTM